MKRLVLYGGFAVGLVMAPDAAGAAEMAAHKAVYDLSMGRAEATSRYAGVTGIVSRSVERTCDGWIVAEQMALRVQTKVGGEIDRDVRFTGFESFDGKAYQFAGRTVSKASGEDTGFKGSMKRERAGGPGEAAYTLPSGRTVTLPDNTYLPVAHLGRLLDEAAAGKKDIQFNVFDGSEQDGPQLMSSIVVGHLPAAENAQGLAAAEAWRFNSALFALGGRQETPDVQFDMELMVNGVPRRLVLDLGGFTVVQTLKEVEALPPPKCP